MSRISNWKMPVLVLGSCACLLAAPVHAAFVLHNLDGGDGFVSVDSPSKFTLSGSDNGSGLPSLTTYIDTAASAATISGNFLYTTFDDGGSSFDPAGFTVNGLLTLLSDDGLDFLGSNAGSFMFLVNVGDVFGFYVNSDDNTVGRGQLSIDLASSVPEPSTSALLIAGLALAGVSARRRRDPRAVA